MQRTGQRPRFQNNGFNPNPNNNRFVKNKFGNKQQGHGQMNGPKSKGNRDAVIAKNLEHMNQVSHKKRIAQEMYYGDARSPLIKTSSGNFVREVARPSVQQRLGDNRFPNRQNKFSPNQNNKVGVTFNRRNMNISPRNVNPIRANSVNNRLNRNIVRNNVPNKNNFVRNNALRPPVRPPIAANRNQFNNNRGRHDKLQRVQNFHGKRRNSNANTDTSGMVKMVNSKGKLVYLVPSRNNYTPRKPPTLSVRVDNDHRHHVQNGLNPVLQQEIKIIQAKAGLQPPSFSPAIHHQAEQQVAYSSVANLNAYGDKLPVTSTRQTLNERFSSI